MVASQIVNFTFYFGGFIKAILFTKHFWLFFNFNSRDLRDYLYDTAIIQTDDQYSYSYLKLFLMEIPLRDQNKHLGKLKNTTKYIEIQGNNNLVRLVLFFNLPLLSSH